MSGPSDDPRALALDVLHAVLRQGVGLEDALASHPRHDRLRAIDRGFLRSLLATTLRRLGAIDAALATCLDRPLKPGAERVLDALRLGAAQILFLRVPAYAAVATSVDLAGSRHPWARGLANAVLRRLDREGSGMLAAQDAAAVALPAWIFEGWITSYGDATARAMARAVLTEPPLDLTPRGDPTVLAAKFPDAEVLPTGSVRLPPGEHGPVPDLEGFSDGDWWVQDAAAAIPARLLGDVRGRQVLDLCSAPGGKAMQLAAAGAMLTAVEIGPQRIERLRANLARTGLAATVVEADATAWQPNRPAAAVLLDAPCSGTGTIRRHPDIARHKSRPQIAALTEMQDRLLDAAAAALAPGGTLVYAVCSLEPEEGPARVAAVLARHAGLARAPIAHGELPGLDGLLTPDGDLRTRPDHWAVRGGLDGHYAARLRRPG